MKKKKRKKRGVIVITGKSHRNFCANFKALRMRLGMTQEELARDMHISRTYIADLERGRNCPSLDVLDMCAKGLSIKPQILLRDAAAKIVRNPS